MKFNSMEKAQFCPTAIFSAEESKNRCLNTKRITANEHWTRDVIFLSRFFFHFLLDFVAHLYNYDINFIRWKNSSGMSVWFHAFYWFLPKIYDTTNRKPISTVRTAPLRNWRRMRMGYVERRDNLLEKTTRFIPSNDIFKLRLVHNIACDTLTRDSTEKIILFFRLRYYENETRGRFIFAEYWENGIFAKDDEK